MRTLDGMKFDSPLCAIITIATQPIYQGFDQLPVRPMMQVILRPDKIRGNLIRLGESQGDEAYCWIEMKNVEVVEILGNATEKDGKWTVTPILESAA